MMETEAAKEDDMVDRKAKANLTYLGYLPSVVLVVALGLGLYTQWQFTQNNVILGFAILGFFIFAVSCALRYYFNFELIGQTLLHIWLGCILGIIIFADQKEIEFVMSQEVTNVLLVTSAVLTWCWNLLERMLHLVKHEAKMFTTVQILESIGLMISTLVTGKDALSFSLLVLAFNVNLASIRLKSFLGLLSFIAMVCVSVFVIFQEVGLSGNFYGLACFAARHSFEPFIDLYFSGLTTLQRWQGFFNLSKFLRYIFVLVVFAFNIATGAVIGKLSATHKEWYIVVPLTVVFACIWLCFHLTYFITCWKLMSKITECNLTYNSLTDERKNMSRIMASKGVRHFSLISQRLICITLLTTVLLGGLGWETRKSYSLGMILLVLPIECMTLSLFWYLGDNLGGTATGYAVIAPVTGHKRGSRVNIMSQEAMQDMGTRATTTLNKVSYFFNYHMIDNYGCDYSTSGLAIDYLESKLKAFFDRRMSDGPKYDSYILYFSGDVYENGEWALSDNSGLKLETLLEWWASKNSGCGTRLILILDTTHSYMWAKDVQRVWGEYVAIQTCTFQKSKDIEFGNCAQVGTFTQDYVHFNAEAEIFPGWSAKERTVKAVYKVSKCWTDFTFHLPTVDEIYNHWDSSFPRCMKPLIKAVNIGGTGSLCFCCHCLTRCLKRKRMKWLPPKQIDTGHGFKLIRS
ncbi:transmembrane protein 168-like [Mytilus californianus]|uniref:transmembrane protein 168-like n=1 Tax=Mytilus californianus TaxID=6549 RepID=UPI0022457671|nr:transmembrane protein 168-like [Mytilus californianus]